MVTFYKNLDNENPFRKRLIFEQSNAAEQIAEQETLDAEAKQVGLKETKEILKKLSEKNKEAVEKLYEEKIRKSEDGTDERAKRRDQFRKVLARIAQVQKDVDSGKIDEPTSEWLVAYTLKASEDLNLDAGDINTIRMLQNEAEDNLRAKERQIARRTGETKAKKSDLFKWAFPNSDNYFLTYKSQNPEDYRKFVQLVNKFEENPNNFFREDGSAFDEAITLNNLLMSIRKSQTDQRLDGIADTSINPDDYEGIPSEPAPKVEKVTEGGAKEGKAEENLVEKVRREVAEEKRIEESQTRMEGYEADLPEHFRGEDSYDHIEKMKYLESGGKEVYGAINTLARIRGELGSPINNRAMWNKIRGNILPKDGGRWIITFNEICKATYGMNSKKFFRLYKDIKTGSTDMRAYRKKKEKLTELETELRDNTEIKGKKRARMLTKVRALKRVIAEFEDVQRMEEFMAAAETILIKIPETEYVGGGLDEQKEVRENIEWEGEMKTMAGIAGQFFTPNDYGAPVRFGPAKALSYLIKGKDRPVITENTWGERKAYTGYFSIVNYDHENYGEMEIISNARAFDKLMGLGDLEMFQKKLNQYIEQGWSFMVAQAELRGEEPEIENYMDLYIDVDELAAEGGFKPSKTQIELVRNGMMMEALADLSRYQKAGKEAVSRAAETGGDINPIIHDIFLQIQSDPAVNLTREELEEMERKAAKILSGYINMMVMEKDLTNGLNKEDLDYLLGAGLSKELGNGFQLDFMVTGKHIEPVIKDVTAGLTYHSPRFGKKNRWRLEAGARGGVGIDGSPKASAGVAAKWDFKEGGTWSARAAGKITLTDVAVSLGVERDLNRALRKRIEKFKTEHAAEIAAGRGHMFEAIDGIKIDGKPLHPAKAAALKIAAGKYLNEEVERMVAENWTKFEITKPWTVFRKIKFMGADITGVAGYRGPGEGGLGAGFGVSFMIGAKAVSFYVPANEMEVAGASTGSAPEITTDMTAEASAVEVASENWETREAAMKGAYLYTNANEKEAKETEAVADATAVVESISTDDVEFSFGKRFTSFHFKKLSGEVRLYEDPKSTLKPIVKDSIEGPTKEDFLYLNLGTDDNPNFLIREVKDSHGGGAYTEIILTDNANATEDDMDSIIEESTSYVRWVQNLGGKTEDHRMVDHHKFDVEKMTPIKREILTEDEVGLAVETGIMEVKGLSEDGAKALVEKTRYAAINADLQIREWKLFDKIYYAEPMIKIMAKTLSEDPKFNYGKLATGDASAQLVINQRIVNELNRYRETKRLVKTGDPEGKIPFTLDDIDYIAAVRNRIMQMERKESAEMHLNWNKRAYATLDEDAAINLVNDDLDRLAENWAETEKRRIGEFPEGAKLLIFTNQNGEMKVQQGYYDVSVHGTVSGHIVWDKNNPEKTLEVLGVEKTKENRDHVINMTNAIENMPEWKDTGFDIMKSPTDFSSAIKTIIGKQLISIATQVYGEELGIKIVEMSNTGELKYPDLANKFAQNVYDLITKGETDIDGIKMTVSTEIQSGLNNGTAETGGCTNLMIITSPVLHHDRIKAPGKKTIKVRTIRETEEGGMIPQTEIGGHVVRADPAALVKSVLSLINPSEEGGGIRNQLEPGQSLQDLINQKPGGGETDTSQNSPR